MQTRRQRERTSKRANRNSGRPLSVQTNYRLPFPLRQSRRKGPTRNSRRPSLHRCGWIHPGRRRQHPGPFHAEIGSRRPALTLSPTHSSGIEVRRPLENCLGVLVRLERLAFNNADDRNGSYFQMLSPCSSKRELHQLSLPIVIDRPKTSVTLEGDFWKAP